jgi:AcrR family transcriptional regulator
VDTPAPRLPLSRARIIEAALVLIDAEGLDALSMRKLGASLGVEAMSLYNHVRNKDDLLGALTDDLFAQILVRYEASTSPAATWQDRARAIAHAYWVIARDHPNAFPLVSSKPADSIHGLLTLARCVEIFTDAGLPPADASAAFNVAAGWMLGTISQERVLSEKLSDAGRFTRADVPDALTGIIDFREAFLAQPAEVRFAEGLEIVLAGIEARLAAATHRP